MAGLVLCILDGWGLGKESKYNAIHMAKTPNYDYLILNHPHSQLKTSGLLVGLPDGQMGNSEVGHLTIGAGRVLFQDLPKISQSIKKGEFKALKPITCLSGIVHLIGIISDGGVHGHIDHVIEIAHHLKSIGIQVKLHAILDGRDCSPKSAKDFIKKISSNQIEICSVVGRYYAMDRDKRWDRTKAAYDAIILGEGESFEHPIEFIEKSYLDGITDEFVKPGISVNYHGFENGDSVFCTNFRADRMRQICSAIADSEFKEFPIKKLQLANKLMMTSYSKQLENFYEVVYPNSYPKNTLGEVIASKDLKQARIAETEKYAHVTYFFNGGIEVPFEGEERIMVPSPKVATYDLAPQMSASEVTQKVCDEISRRDFICVNFANCDMVGHTGDINATIKAVETVDYSLGRIIEACKEQNVDLLVTADHGNAEDMLDEEKGQPITSHTLNTVPLIYFGSKKCALGDGNLSDVAPTILDFMDIEIPNEMTGKSLWKKD